MSEPSSETCVRFGIFELRPAARTLLVDGQPSKLGARAFDLLSALVDRRDRVVSNHELLDLIWPGLVVEENNVQVQVSTLRKLLGPGAISTVPGRGYRFIEPVEAIGPPSPSPADAGVTQKRDSQRLFGRQHDIDAVRQLLTNNRIVSIVGTGGIGKTRLARAVAATLEAEFVDGICWVDLASISDSGLVVAAVARELGVTLAADRSPTERVVAAFAARRSVLVLDNCEHQLDAVSRLSEALGTGAPRLLLLVTTQEALKVPDEQVYRLATLAVPPPGDVQFMGHHGGAIELFTARAQAVDPRFHLTPDNLPAVADICRRLDGIALAIELAAARVPLLGVEGLRERLNERFKLLTAGARTVLRRHQTLRAALEWSHGLLTTDERQVLRRIGAFAGSFSMASAQAVAGEATQDPWDVLDCLGALVDKSMVLVEGDSASRYRLLETTRAFALEQLVAAGETTAVRQKQAESLLVLLDAQRVAHLLEQPSPADIRALAAELDNLRAALAWCEQAHQPSLAVALAGSSYLVWHAAGALFVEGLERCLDVAPHVEASMPVERRAAFWLTTARLGSYNAHPASFEAARRAAELFGELGDARGRYDALGRRAVIGSRRGERTAVALALAEAVAIEDPAWSARVRGALRFAQQMGASSAGNSEEALDFSWQQAALYREGGLKAGEQLAIGNVAGCEVVLGRFDAAERRAREAFDILEGLGEGANGGHLLAARTNALAGLKRYAEAIEEARRAWRLLEPQGDETRLLLTLAIIAAHMGRFADAARISGHADHALLLRGEVRRPHELAWRTDVAALLSDALTHSEQVRQEAEGAMMLRGEVFRLAMGE